jgi:hypothetical protein
MGEAALHGHGAAAEPREARGGSGMKKSSLPGLRPVRLRLGFAAAQKNLSEKVYG